jgi:ferrochelatase
LRDRDLFLAAGGERLDYIPALNDSAAHVDVMEGLVRRYAADWLQTASAHGAPAA